MSHLQEPIYLVDVVTQVRKGEGKMEGEEARQWGRGGEKGKRERGKESWIEGRKK